MDKAVFLVMILSKFFFIKVELEVMNVKQVTTAQKAHLSPYHVQEENSVPQLKWITHQVYVTQDIIVILKLRYRILQMEMSLVSSPKLYGCLILLSVLCMGAEFCYPTSCPRGEFCTSAQMHNTSGLCDSGYYCHLKATVPNPTDGNVTGKYWHSVFLTVPP